MEGRGRRKIAGERDANFEEAGGGGIDDNDDYNCSLLKNTIAIN
jgi:hypothetical protein